jgi:hypothetical protein
MDRDQLKLHFTVYAFKLVDPELYEVIGNGLSVHQCCCIGSEGVMMVCPISHLLSFDFMCVIRLWALMDVGDMLDIAYGYYHR